MTFSVTVRKPTKSDRKFGRANCAKCGEPAYRIWGVKPNAYPLCAIHNNEYIDAIIDRLENPPELPYEAEAEVEEVPGDGDHRAG